MVIHLLCFVFVILVVVCLQGSRVLPSAGYGPEMTVLRCCFRICLSRFLRPVLLLWADVCARIVLFVCVVLRGLCEFCSPSLQPSIPLLFVCAAV